MSDSQKMTKSKLNELHALLEASSRRQLETTVPYHVIDTLLNKTSGLVCTEFDSEDIRTFVRAAFHAIGDAGATDEDDPILKQLLEINASLTTED